MSVWPKFRTPCKRNVNNGCDHTMPIPDSVNKGAERTVGTRYREDLVDLLDVIAKRRGQTRSDVVRAALDREIEREFPGATRSEAA